MKMVLVRVGIDSGSGGIQGPLFEDGTFEYLPIPDRLTWEPRSSRYVYHLKGVGIDERRYGNTSGRHGGLLIEYFPATKQSEMAQQSIHYDPEFSTFTYGDPSGPKAGLRKLCSGDMLVFYCGLEGRDFASPPALYLLGYFEVSRVAKAAQFSRDELLNDFGANYHVRHAAVYRQQRPHLLLINGGPESRVLTKAKKISRLGQDCRGRPLKVLSQEMHEVFGDLGGKNSLQRSTPRWIKPEFVLDAAEYIRSLK